ncbi:MAG: hypothetical protein ACF8MF_06655 [Phycisphaerales bacterium JB052]
MYSTTLDVGKAIIIDGEPLRLAYVTGPVAVVTWRQQEYRLHEEDAPTVLDENKRLTVQLSRRASTEHQEARIGLHAPDDVIFWKP